MLPKSEDIEVDMSEADDFRDSEVEVLSLLVIRPPKSPKTTGLAKSILKWSWLKLYSVKPPSMSPCRTLM